MSKLVAFVFLIIVGYNKNMREELLRQKRIHGLPEVVTPEEEQLLLSKAPVQKIIGFINFDNLTIKVNRHVLIPRYETEEVVNEATRHIARGNHILDLCCGSGYIGLTIKQKMECHVTLSDVSSEAIQQTRENALLNNLDVKVIESDMFENINSKFDVIISNPPYIPNSTKLSDSVLKHEPHNALFGGVDGNDFYRQIVKQAHEYLHHGGFLILEVSPDNVPYIKEEGFHVFKDINGKDRIAVKQF